MRQLKEMTITDLQKLYDEENYEAVIREIDGRFGWNSEELGRNEFTKGTAERLLNAVKYKRKHKRVL